MEFAMTQEGEEEDEVDEEVGGSLYLVVFE